jgi:hypothetical protein
LLLDGTWNEDATVDQDTNIVRLRDAMVNSIIDYDAAPPHVVADITDDDNPLSLVGKTWAGTDYLFFYERGVGTGPGLDRVLGGALGWGVSQNVRRAYRFLSRYYVPGAEIFIFGFSRGSYTARSLVGYLGSAGLLRAECCLPEIEQDAWNYYRTAPNDRLSGVQVQLQKYTHSSQQLRIHCLGVFDTVGSLGVPSTLFRRFNREKYQFHDVDLSPIVKVNLQALALDEHRLQFGASVWRYNKMRLNNSVTEQAWFPGAHSDLGGGYYSNEERKKESGLDDIALDWMIKRLGFHYPSFRILGNAVQLLRGKPKTLRVLHDSRTWKYRLSPPALRSVQNIPPAVLYEEKIVSYNRDAFAVGESVHVSALERLARRAPYEHPRSKRLYLPRNLIEVLPRLYTRYCEYPEQYYGPEELSVTNWAGQIVDTLDTSDPDSVAASTYVRDAIDLAVRRLNMLGYDVTSKTSTWNSFRAAWTLAASRPADCISRTWRPALGRMTRLVSRRGP